MSKCICNLKEPSVDDSSYGYETIDENEMAVGDYTTLSMERLEDGKYLIVATGEGRAEYFPKYCPECGRKL